MVASSFGVSAFVQCVCGGCVRAHEWACVCMCACVSRSVRACVASKITNMPRRNYVFIVVSFIEGSLCSEARDSYASMEHDERCVTSYVGCIPHK